MNTGGARADEGARGSRATDGTAAVSLGSEEADTGAGAEAGASVNAGGARAGEGARGSRATDETAAVSLGSGEADNAGADTAAGAEADGGTDGATC